MEIRDLEKGIIMWPYEIERTGLDIAQYIHLGDSETPPVKGFFEKKIRKKLTDYIQKEMQRQDAYIAIITKETDIHSFLTETKYSFSMYKI